MQMPTEGYIVNLDGPSQGIGTVRYEGVFKENNESIVLSFSELFGCGDSNGENIVSIKEGLQLVKSFLRAQ